MTLITIAILILLRTTYAFESTCLEPTQSPLEQPATVVEKIDSLDIVIFDLDSAIYEPHYIDIPVYIISDDVINALDFSMAINIKNLEFLSAADHTGHLQHTAYVNPNDQKLRFTSNSFNAYPTVPVKVVSIRFEVLSNSFNRSDLQTLMAYLNGDRCSIEIKGDDVNVATNDVFDEHLKITPNPATEQLYIETKVACTVDMFTLEGRAILQDHTLNGHGINVIDVHWMPRGTYTVRIRSGEHTLRTQMIVLQ